MPSRILRTLPLAALAGLALLGACEQQDAVVQPITGTPGGELFARYVALGNSITAGLQSGGINEATQMQAYPVLLANQAGAPFGVPLLNMPGCPPPFIAPLGVGGRLGGTAAPPCALRRTPVPGVVQNIAVPGALIGDANTVQRSADPQGTFNSLQFFFLGGQTLLGAVERAQPTLVSVWLGNNDVLGGAVSGNVAGLTSEAAFAASLDTVVTRLRGIPTLQDALLIGVVNVNQVPLLQPGAYFFLSRDAQGRFNNKPVNNNCSPVTALGQPNPDALNLISFSIVGDAAFPEINCSNEAYPVGDPRRGAYVLSAAEQATVAARTAAFNAAIQQRATQNGWMYLDPNVLLAQIGNQTDPQGRYQRLRKCQALPAALQSGNPALIQQAVVTSCPVPDAGATAPFAAPNFFGSLISFDGVHPSSEAHRRVTNAMIELINATHTLSIPALSVN